MPPSELSPGASPAASAQQPSQRTAFLLLLAVIVIWGANWPILKIGLTDIAPLTFAAFRLALGAISMFLLLAWRGELSLPTREDMPVVWSVGLLQLAAFLICINLGLMHVDASRSAILSYTTMIWVTPAAIWLLGEQFSWLKIIGVFCGIAGIAVMFNPAGFDWNDHAALLGNGYLLAGAFAWAVSILHVRVHRWRQSALVLAPWQLLVGFVPTAILAVFWESDQPIHWTPSLLAVLAFNGPIATAFAVWAWITVNRGLPAIVSSMGSLGVPVAGAIFSILMLGESVTLENAAGLALLTLGLAIVSLEAARER